MIHSSHRLRPILAIQSNPSNRLETDWTTSCWPPTPTMGRHAANVLPVQTSRGVGSGRARWFAIGKHCCSSYPIGCAATGSGVYYFLQWILQIDIWEAILLICTGNSFSPVPFMGRLRAYRFHSDTHSLSRTHPTIERNILRCNTLMIQLFCCEQFVFGCIKLLTNLM